MQYNTLRKEIENSKDRIFKIMAGEAFIVPATQYLSTSSDNAHFIKLLLPFIVMILVLRYLYENNSIMRSGLYIRKYIEPYLKPEIDQFMAWEEWLESEIEITENKKCSPRKVESYARNGFYIMSFVYYIISVYLAWDYLTNEFPDKNLTGASHANVALIIYSVVVLYLVVGIYISLKLRKCKISTKMDKEHAECNRENM